MGLPAPAVELDVREFARTAVGTHRPHLQLAAFAEDPLPADALTMVAALQALEHGTMRHLRQVLVTPAHQDAATTAFLVTWAFEKHWVADALQAIADANGAGAPAPLPPMSARRRIEPAVESLVSHLIGDDVIATQMAACAIDGWAVEVLYEHLRSLTPHVSLHAALARIDAVKARHQGYFVAQARRRLAASAGAIRVSRRRLARMRFPLGADLLPRSQAGPIRRALTPAKDRVQARIDGLGDLRLPGLLTRSLNSRPFRHARR